MSDLLQKAIDNLQIEDVFQKSINAFCANNFEPKYNDFDEIEVQFMHVVRRSEVLQLENADDSRRFFRVIIMLGVRWVKASESKTSDESQIEELAKIEGRMIAEYLMKAEVPPEALDEFAKRNASFHVWPYWREVVASQCSKMNLPVVVLPAVQFASNRASEPTEEDS